MIKHKLHKKKIIASFLRSVLSTFFLVAYFFGVTVDFSFNDTILKFSTSIWVLIGIFLLINLFNLLFNYLIYKGEYYYFTEDSLVYEYNFIIKKKVSLPYNKINLITAKRGFIDILVGGTRLLVGSGSVSTSVRPEISLYFDKTRVKEQEIRLETISQKAKNAEEIIETDFGLKEEIITNHNAYRLNKGDIWKMIYSSGGLYIGLLLCLFFFVFGLVSINHFVAEKFLNIFIIWGGIGICVLFVLLISLLCVFFTWLKYYNFSIYRDGDNIKINYGLISVNNFSIPTDKIHGIIQKESIMRQLFSLGSLQLSVVGLVQLSGDNNQGVQIPFLLPIGKLARLQEVSQSLLPEFQTPLQKPFKANKRSIKHFFLIPNLWISFITLPLITFFAVIINYPLLWLPYIIILAMINLKYWFEYRNASFIIGKKDAQFVSGGFVRETMLCKTGSIQEVTSIAGFIRQNDKLATMCIIVRGGVGSCAKIKVRNIKKPETESYFR